VLDVGVRVLMSLDLVTILFQVLSCEDTVCCHKVQNDFAGADVGQSEDRVAKNFEMAFSMLETQTSSSGVARIDDSLAIFKNKGTMTIASRRRLPPPISTTSTTTTTTIHQTPHHHHHNNKDTVAAVDSPNNQSIYSNLMP
jgi:hypothetical protein